ncbi:GNAT family N-acetyltransferase [candidate division KSB1 bacterium]|nr:GNAT family N-acetyltransferase [candidate division KSB1 bacterium]
MNIEIEPYSDSMSETWDEFVWNSNNGTLFQTRKFLKYHPAERFEDQSLVFKKKNQLVALFPATVRYENHRKILSSHRGASYGGIVTRSTVSIKDSFQIVELLIDYARENGFKGIDLTPPPQIYFTKPTNYVDFALMVNGFGYKKREISSVIPLFFQSDEVLETFTPESRRAVRRAVKLGVTIQESDRFDEFYAILQNNLNMRHNVKPTHTLEEIYLLKKIYPDRIKLFGAFLEDGTMIAGVIMFNCNEKVTLAFYISHNQHYQQYRGVNYLFFEIIKWAISQGFSYLDFGIFTVDMDPNWGLGRFKESFGALGVFRDTFLKYLD